MLSVLGMTIGDKRDCLKYRLQGGSDAVSSWGHEYIKFNIFKLENFQKFRIPEA